MIQLRCEPPTLPDLVTRRRRRAAAFAALALLLPWAATAAWSRRIDSPIGTDMASIFAVTSLVFLALACAYAAWSELRQPKLIDQSQSVEIEGLSARFPAIRDYLAQVRAQGRPVLIEDHAAIRTLAAQLRVLP